MRRGRLLTFLTAAGLMSGLGAAVATRERWRPLLPTDAPEPVGHAHPPAGPPDRVTVSPQAQAAMRLDPRPLVTTTFWRTVTVPGLVVERPGAGDRAVSAPAAGVVVRVHRTPGETVRPGDDLFTLRLSGEGLPTAQAELFKATAEVGLVQDQRRRLASTPGAVPEARVIDADNQLARLRTGIRAYRQELAARGLRTDQIDAAARGEFVTELTVGVPPAPAGESAADAGPGLELQELRADRGQPVPAGFTLAVLSDHRKLAVEGRAFRDEVPAVERAVREDWPVEAEFADDAVGEPPPPPLRVGYLSNTVDPLTHTVAFRADLENTGRVVERAGRAVRLWRYRPGQPVRLHLRADKLDGVFVLPAGAVAREGGEAFLFRQNGDSFDRRPVHLLHLDRRHAVVADDGAVPAGVYVATGGAAQLNRAVKARQGAAGGHDHDHDH